MYDLVIKNGHVVTAQASFEADVAVNGETIVALGQGFSGRREIDAMGKLVTPGAVDIHVHMQMPLPNGFISSDTFFTGTRAAALGGTTAIVDFAAPEGDQPMLEALAARRAEADDAVVIDYGLHMTLGPTEISKLDQVQAAYNAGCATFKLYMAYGFYLDDGELLLALEAVRDTGGLPVIHAENWRAIQALVACATAAGNIDPIWHPRTRPALLEGEAVGRAIDIATYVGVPLHVFHVGCVPVVARITAARAQGLPITGETCPQYLALDDSALTGNDAELPICAPPLRPEADRAAMWAALASDHLQIVTTDHCPFTRPEKARGLADGGFHTVPGGVPSVEVRYALAYSMGVREGHFTENRWVDACCTRPAQMAGFTRKGLIAPGYDADLCVFDPGAAWTVNTDTLHENCDWTPYDGLEMTGRAQHTISRGRVIVENGIFVGQKGHGNYVKRSLAR